MTKERSTKIVNFVTPGAGVIMVRCGHIGHYSEYALSSTLTLNIQHINCYCIKEILMLLSSAIVDFYLFHDMIDR